MSTDDEQLALADEIAADAAGFAAAVEAVAAGADPSAAVSVLILALSGMLAAGARLGAQEDIVVPGDPVAPGPQRAARLAGERNTGHLAAALAEQFGGVDEYFEVVDPYLAGEVSTARLSVDLADIAGDLLQGLALYTDGRPHAALAWWQYSYLSNWGSSASAALRAVQSLVAALRLGAAMGLPGDDALL